MVIYGYIYIYIYYGLGPWKCEELDPKKTMNLSNLSNDHGPSLTLIIDPPEINHQPPATSMSVPSHNLSGANQRVSTCCDGVPHPPSTVSFHVFTKQSLPSTVQPLLTIGLHQASSLPPTPASSEIQNHRHRPPSPPFRNPVFEH